MRLDPNVETLGYSQKVPPGQKTGVSYSIRNFLLGPGRNLRNRWFLFVSFPLFLCVSVLLNSKVFSPHEESASSASSLCLGVSVVQFFAASPRCASVSPCLI